MTVDAHYFSPTTPGAASFDVDVSDAIRRGRIGPLSKEAQVGAVGSGIITLDDVIGDLGQAGDGIRGLKQFYMNETDCPAGNQRFFTGYTFDRSYYRANSLVQGESRTIDVTLLDPNAFLSFRVFAPDADDPTSSFVRPAETHIERIQALLAVDFLSTTLFDLGYIPSTGGVDMSERDYTGSRPVDVVNECAQVANWNAWVGYDETENKLFLWFDDWKTDGSDTTVYDSTLKLTNVRSEHEADPNTVLLMELNWRETRDPSRVIAGAYGTGTGITSYRTLPETAHIFGWRDAVIPSFYVKEQAKLDALLDLELSENSSEDIRLSGSVQVPVDLVTAIKEGQRIPVHGTHMRSVSSTFTWCRILHLSVRRDVETMEFYWLDLEVSPIPVVGEPQFFTSTNFSGCEVGTWPEGSPGDGLLLVGFLAQRDNSTSDATIVPIGNGVAPGSETCDDTVDIPGTEWTFIDNLTITNGAGQSGQLTLAYRDSEPSEPEVIRWGGIGGLAGTSRPRSHQIAIEGLSGAPTVTQKGTCAMGATMTSPSITVPAAGYIFAGFLYRCTGPADGASNPFTLAAQAPAVDLTQGFQYANFGGYSWFGYLHVAAGGTYDIALDRSNAPRGSHAAGWVMGFWPE